MTDAPFRAAHRSLPDLRRRSGLRAQQSVPAVLQPALQEQRLRRLGERGLRRRGQAERRRRPRRRPDYLSHEAAPRPVAMLLGRTMGDARVRTFGLHPVAALGVALLLSACAAKPPPKPASVTGTIQASAQINPSASKRPSPLLIRVYELKSVAAFNAADFMSLYQRDQAELGADLLAKEEFVLDARRDEDLRQDARARHALPRRRRRLPRPRARQVAQRRRGPAGPAAEGRWSRPASSPSKRRSASDARAPP